MFVRSSLCRRQNLPQMGTLFCLGLIKKSFLFNLSCVLIWSSSYVSFSQDPPLPPLQTENLPHGWMPVWHWSSDPTPCPPVLSHLRHPEAPSLSQCNGPACEAVGIGGVATAGGGLCLTDRTEHLAWPEMKKKKKKKNPL